MATCDPSERDSFHSDIAFVKTPDTSTDPTVTIGDSGCAIPHLVTKTLSSSIYKETQTIWKAANCSWPLLDPSSKVSSMVADLLPERASRRSLGRSPNSWTVGALVTLGEALQGNHS
jgi:hypothetical protein